MKSWVRCREGTHRPDWKSDVDSADSTISHATERTSCQRGSSNVVCLALRLRTNELYIGIATRVVRVAAVKWKIEQERIVCVMLNAVVVRFGNGFHGHIRKG